MSPSITPTEVVRLRKSDPGLCMIDVRTPAEYHEVHIEGANHMDMSTQTFMTEILSLPREGTYVLYCASGGRSSLAASFMASAGFEHVYDIHGGIEAWLDAGLPVVQN